ncbi:response regulator transcription factor [Proteiniborus sp. MB09-C3]|uniref:response regulator transcription factor n=1 Tax=Proteiniborus sp. MB09-C3 TaxID=3050072 RepID=UPI002554BAF1|nr:response regulator transcription factor [Proteiniborus sp. MB09-C3]WIV12956.1 response regulator transcription factor [Proteiniborus sp. MB09-C3]
MERILIIEDEEKIARFIELELKYEGYEVEKAFNGRDGLKLATTQPFDLVLLDIMLPALNGLEVLRRIRKSSDLPVILLTARDAVVDKVTGLDGGADDYITKPFAIEELLARIRATLRKKSNNNATKTLSELIAGELSLDPIRREVKVGDNLLDLTKKEFDLLHYLLENKNIVVSRETLLQHIWGYDFSGGTNAVDVYIRYLRSKVEEPFGLKLLHTVRGVGYVIKDE